MMQAVLIAVASANVVHSSFSGYLKDFQNIRNFFSCSISVSLKIVVSVANH